FAGLGFRRGVELARKAASLVPAGMRMSTWALRWILDHPEVAVVIPGATKAEQVLWNVQASGTPPLQRVQHERIKRFYEEEVMAYIRGPY
ncbi:MAG: aldo/keto reductase, partial [Candidatus Bipolaricaulota bacterium]